MEQEFNKASKTMQALHDVIQEALKTNPQAQIRDVGTALKKLTAVYVNQGVDHSNGYELPNGQYSVDLCCDDGAEKFSIPLGRSRHQAEKMALEICAQNKGIKVIPSHDLFIAVNPNSIKDVTDRFGKMDFKLKNSAHSFTVMHADEHRAYIDAVVLGNRILSMQSAAPAPKKTGRSASPRSEPSV